MNTLKKFELRELEPLTGNLSALRLKLRNGDSYAGIGELSLKKNMLEVVLEWHVRLVTNDRGEDDFERGKAITIMDSVEEEEYVMRFKPTSVLFGEDDWETIETDEGKILVSFDEKQIEVIKKLN